MTRRYRATVTEVWDTRRPADELLQARKSDALFHKILIQDLAELNEVPESHIWRQFMRTALAPHPSEKYKDFSGIVFDPMTEPGVFGYRGYNPATDTVVPPDTHSFEPFLEVHFHPRSLDNLRSSMGDAAKWLSEPAVRNAFPTVSGCTYRELAKLATKFGFEAFPASILRTTYRNELSISHAIFQAFNNRPASQMEASIVTAPTSELAECWANL